jgi:hypothetical protein
MLSAQAGQRFMAVVIMGFLLALLPTSELAITSWEFIDNPNLPNSDEPLGKNLI